MSTIKIKLVRKTLFSNKIDFNIFIKTSQINFFKNTILKCLNEDLNIKPNDKWYYKLIPL